MKDIVKLAASKQTNSNKNKLIIWSMCFIILSLYLVIWLGHFWKDDYILSKIEFLGSLDTILDSLRQLLKGEGGYARFLFAWLSVLSLLSFSNHLGGWVLSLFRKGLPIFFQGQKVVLGIVLIIVLYTTSGIAGIISASVAYFIFALGLLTLCVDLFRISKNLKKIKERVIGITLSDKFLIVWFFLCSCSIVSIPTFPDFLWNQLGLPYYYANEMSLKPNPYQHLSYTAQNLEMLFIHFALLDSWQAINLSLWFIWAFTTILIYQITAELSDKRFGALSAIWFVFTPVTYKLFIHGKNDMFAVMYFLCAIIILFKLQENLKYLKIAIFIIGIFIGAAIGTKYVALVYLPPIFLCFLFLILRLGATKHISYSVVAILFSGIVLTGGFWYLRNFFWSGNPFYPFYSSLIPTRFVESYHNIYMHISGSNLLTFGVFSGLEKLVILLAGFTPDLGSARFLTGEPTPMSWGITLPLILFNFVGITFISPKGRWLLLIGFFGLAGMFFLEPAIRYFPLTVACLCIVTTSTIYSLSKNLKCNWLYHYSLILILFSILTPTYLNGIATRTIGNLPLVVSGIDTLHSVKVISGVNYPVDAQDLLKMGHYINTALPSNSRILIVGEDRPPLLRKRFLIQSDPARQIIDDWLNETKSVEGLLRKIKNERVTHLLVNTNYFQSNVQYGTPFQSPDVTKLHWEAMPVVKVLIQNHCTLIATVSNKELCLYAVN